MQNASSSFIAQRKAIKFLADSATLEKISCTEKHCELRPTAFSPSRSFATLPLAKKLVALTLFSWT